MKTGDELTEPVPGAGPAGHAPAPGDLPSAPRRRRAPHGRVALRAGAGRDADDVAEDRVPNRARSRSARRGRACSTSAPDRCGSTPTSSTSTITSCAAAAAGCATSRSSSTACKVPGRYRTRLHRRRRASDLPRSLRSLRLAACAAIHLSPTAKRSNAKMPKLDGTKTHDNLKAAFAGESQANRRYLYFAQKADVEGHPDVAALFRSVAEGETGHAFGHFDFLAEVGDPATGVAVGASADNLQVGRRRRDLRVHRDVPGLRQDRSRRGSRGDRGVARDARPRREEPRRSLPGRARIDQLTRVDAAGYDPLDPRSATRRDAGRADRARTDRGMTCGS